MNDPLRAGVPLGAHPPGSAVDHQCTGGPHATSWCGRAATLVASANWQQWFCCEAHTGGAPALPIVEWYRRYVTPDYSTDRGVVRECLVCNNHQICNKYSDWTCGNCGQAYIYDETDPKILLTDVQRELLRKHFEANRALPIDVVVEQADESPGDWRCQFCGEESPQRKWKKDQCPKCGRKYDALLAQDEDDS